MSDMLDAFADEMNRTYSVYPKGNSLDVDGEVVQGFASTPALTDIECAFYTGSAAEALISDRYKTQASGVIISRVYSVPDKAKIVLSSGEEFIVLHADDVMEQGEVLVISVGVENYGIGV